MKTKITNHVPTFLAAIMFLFLVHSPNAQALTVSPVRIELSGDSGTTITKEITLSNDSQAGEETYYISYSNFEAQGETGSPLFVEPKSDLGTWMTTPEQSVTLKANESKKVLLSINIPQDAYAGGHFAVVFFGNNPNNTDGGQVSVGAKTGTLILLSVNGDVLEAGGLASFNTIDKKFFFNTLPVGLEYRFKNDGNDRVKPDGKIKIRNTFYIPVETLDANTVSGNVLPHSTRLFSTEWIKHKTSSIDDVHHSFIGSYFDKVSYQWKNFALGLYIAKLDLVYGTAGIHNSKTALFFVFPWQLMIIIILILLVIFFVGRKFIKGYNRRIIEKARLSMQNTQNEADHV